MQQTIVELVPSVVEDLVQLAQDSNSNVRKQALMIILQSIEDKSNRLLFLPSKFIKIILNLVGDQNTNTSALSVVIQFSQDEEFLDQLVEFKATQQISDLLKELVLTSFKEKRSFDEQEILFIELAQLALSNLTQSDDAKRQFMQLEESEFYRCFNLKLFLNFFVDDRTKTHFKHFLQVLLNLTSREDCRLVLIEEHLKIFDVLGQLLIQPIQLMPIQAIKNLLFEFEKDETIEQVKKYKLIDYIVRFVSYDLYLNYESINGITQDQIKINLQLDQNNVEQRKPEQFMQRLMESLKCLLILTNVDFIAKKIEYDLKKVENLVDILRRVKKLDSSAVDQIDVIETCYVNAMRSQMPEQ